MEFSLSIYKKRQYIPCIAFLLDIFIIRVSENIISPLHYRHYTHFVYEKQINCPYITYKSGTNGAVCVQNTDFTFWSGLFYRFFQIPCKLWYSMLWIHPDACPPYVPSWNQRRRYSGQQYRNTPSRFLPYSNSPDR